jgi:superfamily II DNA/RNA helicase
MLVWPVTRKVSFWLNIYTITDPPTNLENMGIPARNNVLCSHRDCHCTSICVRAPRRRKWILLISILLVPSCSSWVLHRRDARCRFSPSPLSRLYAAPIDPATPPNHTPSFADLGIEPRILSAVSFQQWTQPTAIQQLVIPQLLQVLASTKQGSATAAVWCQAPTGEGKTACFALPLLQRLLPDPSLGVSSRKTSRPSSKSTPTSTTTHTTGMGRVRALILCPTRELAVQIGTVVQDLAMGAATAAKQNQRAAVTTPSVMVVAGGVPPAPQRARLAACVAGGSDIDIMIATPGRLVDLLVGLYPPTANAASSTDAKTTRSKRSPPQSNGWSSASEPALEQRLLAALDARGKKQSLSWEQIKRLSLDNDDFGAARRDVVRKAAVFQQLEYLVLDEADRLLGPAFATEMETLWDMWPSTEKRRTSLHTWLFSATFPKLLEPRVYAALTRIHGGEGSDRVNVTRISCSNADRVASDETSASLARKLERTCSTLASHQTQIGPASTIHLRAICLEQRDRTQALRHLLASEPTWDRVLVFCATRYTTEHLSRKLRRAGLTCAEWHGQLEPTVRTQTWQAWTDGHIRVLVATDLASRGLDMVGLTAVVNYDLPRSPADLVHRIGRTGRAGQGGNAISFITAENEAHWELLEQRCLMEPLERETLPGLKPDAEQWRLAALVAKSRGGLVPTTTTHSDQGLAHDRMFGGVKGRRPNKKDKIRAAQAAQNQ